MAGHLPQLEAIELTTIQLPLLAADSSPAWWIVGGVFAVVSCGLIAAYLHLQRADKTSPAGQQPHRAPVRSPFDELVEAHQLSADEVTVLRQAIQHFSPAQPILVFVDPELLSRYSHHCPDAAALWNKLFAEPQDSTCQDSHPADQTRSNTPTADRNQAASEREPSIDAVADDLLEHLPRVGNPDQSETLSAACTETV